MFDNIRNILFVCTGNSCRSIMAEAYLKKKLKDENIDKEVRSAGTLGLSGNPPTKEALQVIKENGMSTDGYFSKPLTETALSWADVILVMGPRHKDKILSIDPDVEKKVFYLGNFDEGTDNYVIPDPIGTTIDCYRQCFSIIKRSIDGFMKWLRSP